MVWTAKKFYNEFRATYNMELHMGLFFLAGIIFSSAAYPLYYKKVCENTYPRPNDTSQVYLCDDFEDIQSNNAIQKSSTNWMMYGELAKFFPTLLGAMFLGSFGDRYGRKIPMLISVVAFFLYLYFYLVFVTIDSIPIYSITIMAAITSFGGQYVVFLSCQYSEIADHIEDENKLTVRYAILTAFWTGSTFIGGNIAPFMLTYIGQEWTAFIGLGIMVTAFFSVLTLFPDNGPSEKKKLLILNSDLESKDSTQSDVSKTSFEHFGWLKEGLQLYKSAWRALNKTRPNNGRVHLLVYCVVGLIFACEDSGLDSITVLYVYHDPLSWSPQLYTWWSAVNSLFTLLGSVVGAIVFKKFHLSDTMILIISLISAMLYMVGIGIGQKTWVLFAALLVGCFSTVGFSALRALVAQLGTPEESGELLSLINLSVGWCTIFSALVFNNIYVATLDVYIGFPWLFEAFLLLFCIFAIAVVHMQTRKKHATVIVIDEKCEELVERF